MEKIGRKPPSKLTLKTLKEVYTSWQLWAFILPYLMVAEAGSGYNYFNLYLKAEKYSVVKINILPTIGEPSLLTHVLCFSAYSRESQVMQSRSLPHSSSAGYQTQRVAVSGL